MISSKDEVTGLPFPAHAEIALEGFLHPGDIKPDGPFGEWLGYYGTRMEDTPVLRIERVYYRNDPILCVARPGRPPTDYSLSKGMIRASQLWDRVEKAGLPNVKGVWSLESGIGSLFNVISIKQAYPGHSRQALFLASQCLGGAYNGRFVVVVDEDIDPTSEFDVLWAMATRCDPDQAVEIISRAASGSLDVCIPPENKGHSSRCLIDACMPYERGISFRRSPNRAKNSKTRSEQNGVRPSMNKQLLATDSPQQNFPLWKRGIKGDFLLAAKSSAILKISPSPSFSKRGTSEHLAHRLTPRMSFRFLLLAFLLFSPKLLLAQEPLRAGTIFSATQAPLWAAKEGRYFEKYGIKNLEVIQFSGGQPVTRALIGGDIQISTTGGAAVVNARLKGADTVIIARTVGVFPYTLYVGKDIRDAAELKGKKLAVSTVGGSGYVAMQYALRKLGLDPDKDVTMLQVGDFGDALSVARRRNDSRNAASSAVHFAGARPRPSSALRFGRQRHSVSDQPNHDASILHQVTARNREEFHEGICRRSGSLSYRSRVWRQSIGQKSAGNRSQNSSGDLRFLAESISQSSQSRS